MERRKVERYFPSYDELLRIVPHPSRDEEGEHLRCAALTELAGKKRTIFFAVLSVTIARVICMPENQCGREGPSVETVARMEKLLRNILKSNGFSRSVSVIALRDFDDMYRVVIDTPEQVMAATYTFAPKQRLKRCLPRDKGDEGWNAFVDDSVVSLAGKSFAVDEFLDRLAVAYRSHCGIHVKQHHGSITYFFFFNLLRWNRCSLSASAYVRERFRQRVLGT